MSESKEPPSPYPTLLIDRQGACAQVTLNRPAKLNALNKPLRNDLAAVLRDLAEDGEVRVVILTGAGRAFCAGMDLKEFENPEPGGDADPLAPFQALEAMPKPLIAAVNGFAVTGGFELVLACDIIIASHSARFADTHAALGILPGAGISQKLSRMLGQPRAMALSLMGDFLSGEEAFRQGLASHLVADAELLPFARAMAQRIAELEPEVARSMKQLIREGSRKTLGDGIALEERMHAEWTRRGRRKLAASQREAVMEKTRSQAG
jgi:enoyl-CoA hydratase